jgi:hypothetical protein
MAIADDIAKAKNLEALNLKINALQEQMKEAQTSFVQKETQLTKKMDEEIKELFKNGLNNPEIIMESKNDIITGKCGSNLTYSLKISEKERILSKKLDAKEEAYKFRYTFSVHLTGYHGRTLRGTETEEEILILHQWKAIWDIAIKQWRSLYQKEYKLSISRWTQGNLFFRA